MNPEQAKDRRRFFRINDAIGVTYEILGDVNAALNESPQKTVVSIAQILEQHEQAFNEALTPIEQSQPEVARALGALNKKLDTLLNIREWKELSSYHRYQHFEQASISACGLAFPIQESLASETTVRLYMLLQPSGHEVTMTARVVDCVPIDTDSYCLRVEFIDVSEHDRERLIQHIVQRQSRLLKSLREQMEP